MENQENEILETQDGTGQAPAEEAVQEAPLTVEEAQPEAVGAEAVEAEPETVEPEAEAAEPESVYHHGGTGVKEILTAQPQEPEMTPGYTMASREAEKKPRKKRRKLWKRVLSGVLGIALLAGACTATALGVNAYWEERTAEMAQEFQDRLNLLEESLEKQIDKLENDGNSVSGSPAATGDGLTPGQVYAQNVDSTVMVYSLVGNSGYSTGSGFVLTADGYVVTNYHVVEGGTEYIVVTTDNVQHEATYVGGDATNDVAVLKIDVEGLEPVTLGSSDDLIVGDQVAAIGNPLGELTSTLTVGYVSAKGRYVSTESTTINMIQTDAAINSGNSGGALFNMKGEVVGITSAKYSGTSSSGASIEGIGFAIPIDDVIGLIEDIMEFGYVNSAYLGIEVNNQNEIQAGLPDGAYVSAVTPGYCAEAAGIQAGDYIIELDGNEITTMNDLTRILRRLDPGTTVTVVVLRDGQTISLEVTLDARPRDTSTEAPAEQVPMPNEGEYEDWYEYFKWFFENEGRRP